MDSGRARVAADRTCALVCVILRRTGQGVSLLVVSGDRVAGRLERGVTAGGQRQVCIRVRVTVWHSCWLVVSHFPGACNGVLQLPVRGFTLTGCL